MSVTIDMMSRSEINYLGNSIPLEGSIHLYAHTAHTCTMPYWKQCCRQQVFQVK